MNIDSVIEKMKIVGYFEKSDLEQIVNLYVAGNISDEEMTKFIKYVYNYGLNDEETFWLTKFMQNSGLNLDLSMFENTVDKHSSGGVADNTTMIMVPILASLGLTMLKMSGGGLGFTGGTADKVKAKLFGGLENQMEFEKAVEILQKAGGCFLTQSEKMVPADKKIYALRDRTGYIESIPLIASSIASKKLASGAKNIILDIKCFDGAFMSNLSDAKKLGQSITNILKMDDRNACAVITSMQDPLGDFIGDELEAREAVLVLQNKVKNNLYKLSVYLSAKLYAMAKNVDFETAEKLVIEQIESGKAFEKLKQIVELQGGKVADEIERINAEMFVVSSDRAGYLEDIQTKILGETIKEYQKIYDGFIGVEVLQKTGDRLNKNEPIFNVYMEKFDEFTKKEIISELLGIVKISENFVEKPKLILEVID